MGKGSQTIFKYWTKLKSLPIYINVLTHPHFKYLKFIKFIDINL